MSRLAIILALGTGCSVGAVPTGPSVDSTSPADTDTTSAFQGDTETGVAPDTSPCDIIGYTYGGGSVFVQAFDASGTSVGTVEAYGDSQELMETSGWETSIQVFTDGNFAIHGQSLLPDSACNCNMAFLLRGAVVDQALRTDRADMRLTTQAWRQATNVVVNLAELTGSADFFPPVEVVESGTGWNADNVQVQWLFDRDVSVPICYGPMD